MHHAKGVALPLLLLLATLAGCAGTGSEQSAFSIAQPDDPTQPYTFTATVSADNYTWDLGDNLGLVYGNEVQHTYDVVNANLTISLYAKNGDTTTVYKETIVRGTGLNQRAAFVLEAQTNWVIVGEPVRFSGTSSIDPDGDALRFSWSCQRTGDAVRLPTHTHGVSVAPIKTPPPGSVTSWIANRTLPAPTRTFAPGTDLCAALGPVGTQRLSTADVTIEGAFLQQGKYTLFLFAADPAHPSRSGQFEVVVTPAADRPNPLLTWSFSGDFAVGTAGDTANLQETCDLAERGQVCDVFEGNVDMPLGATASWVNFTYEADPTETGQVPAEGQNQAKWYLLQGGQIKASGGPAQGSTPIAGSLTTDASAYVLKVTAEQGGGFGFTIAMQSKMDLDPYKYY